MKSYLCIIILFISAGLFAGKLSEATWNRLKQDMSTDDVIRILGDPKETESSRTSQIWYYQDVPVKENEQIIERPKEGTLVFRINSERVFQLKVWTPPDWAAIPVQSEPEPVTQEVTPQTKTVKPDYKKIREEQLEERKKQYELMQQKRQKEIEEKRAKAEQQKLELQKQRKNYVSKSTSEKKETQAGESILSKYFIIIGIFMVISAFIMAVVYGVKRRG